MILDRTRGGAYIAVFISGIAIFGIFLFLTYYMQQVKGYSPLATGLLFLPMIAWDPGCLEPVQHRAPPRVGPRVLIAAGMLLAAAGTGYLSQLTVTSSYLGDVLPALLVMGLGFGMIFAPAINTATFGVAREDSGVASALVNTMQQVGGSIGTSALSTIARPRRPAIWSPTTPARWPRRSQRPTATPSPSPSRPRCSASASFSPSSLCPPAAGSRNSGERRPRPPSPPLPPPCPSPSRSRAAAPHPEPKAIPVGLCGCSPVVIQVRVTTATPAR